MHAHSLRYLLANSRQTEVGSQLMTFGMRVLQRFAVISSALLLSAVNSVFAQGTEGTLDAIPAGFTTRTIETAAGAEIYVRLGGQGPAVILLHGFGETGDMWAPLSTELAKTHTVIVPDLRGMGRSSHPQNGYDKKTQASDIRSVVTTLGFDRAAVVAHDIGNMVAYAYAVRFASQVDRLVVMDAPIPGLALWEDQLRRPQVWHFNFYGPDVERLVQGRERIYLDRFWNEFAAHPERLDEVTRQHYAALYARTGAMHAAFEQFHAFPQDARDNAAVTSKLTMPILAMGGARSYGPRMAAIMREAGTDVHEAVVPDAGHWLLNENPAFVVSCVSEFLREGANTERAAASPR